MVKLFPVEKTFSNYFLMDYPDTIEFNYSNAGRSSSGYYGPRF